MISIDSLNECRLLHLRKKNRGNKFQRPRVNRIQKNSAMKNIRTRKMSLGKRGAATVELATCLPVIVLLVFGAMEGANMLFLRQAVVQASYEAAKAAVKSNGGKDLAERLASEVLAARNVENPKIQFTPNNPDAVSAGTPVTVRISVDGDSKSITRLGVFKNLTIAAEATMLKE